MTTEVLRKGDVRDYGLADKGKVRIEWADSTMPVLRMIRERFLDEQPLKGIRIGACLHVTTETANLVRTLKAGGAEVYLCASNPLSTRDDVCATLAVHEEIPVFAWYGEDLPVGPVHHHHAAFGGALFTEGIAVVPGHSRVRGLRRRRYRTWQVEQR